LARVCQDQAFPQLYILCEELAQVRWLKSILKDKSPSLNHTREEFHRHGTTLEKMNKREEELKKRGAKRLEMSMLAQDAKMSSLYYSYYALYCKDTHASPYILTSYSLPDQAGEFEDVVWGPVTNNLGEILILIPRLMLLGLAALHMVIDLSLGAELDSLSTALRALENPQKT
jgi:hypothetical protein